jgi:hypothetical protein
MLRIKSSIYLTGQVSLKSQFPNDQISHGGCMAKSNKYKFEHGYVARRLFWRSFV